MIHLPLPGSPQFSSEVLGGERVRQARRQHREKVARSTELRGLHDSDQPALLDGEAVAPSTPGGHRSPHLILLDEPYQGFDQDSYLDFWDQVFKWRDAGAGVLVVTHLLHDLERVDHLLELPRVDES